MSASTLMGSFRTAIQFSALAARAVLGLAQPIRWRTVFQQIHFIANESLGIILFCVCAAAMVTIIEASFHMKLVIQNDSMVPGFASMLILRELGAVVTALLVTSRAGAGMAAEIGSMKVTEQIDALRMLGLNPIQFLVVPRLIACVAAGAMLTVVANMVCLIAAMGVSVIKLGYTPGAYMELTRPFIEPLDLLFSTIKGAAFGAAIPLFSCFSGFQCREGAEGVGLATTQAVVSSSVAIIIIDFFLTFIFSYYY